MTGYVHTIYPALGDFDETSCLSFGGIARPENRQNEISQGLGEAKKNLEAGIDRRVGELIFLFTESQELMLKQVMDNCKNYFSADDMKKVVPVPS